MNKNYNFNQHRNNFSMWAAARAVQRNFTTTENIVIAIENSGLRDFVESFKNKSKEEFSFFVLLLPLQLRFSFFFNSDSNLSISFCLKSTFFCSS